MNGANDSRRSLLTRPRISLKQALAAGSLLCVVLAIVAFFVHRQQRSDAAKRQLSEFCRSKGGSYMLDLVDGDVHLNLAKATLSASDIALLKTLCERCISHDLGDSCDLHFNFDHAAIDGDFMALHNANLISAKVVGLSVAGLIVEDAHVLEIIEKCPRLRTLNLDETGVTDASLPWLAKLPIQTLSLRHTFVTVDGLLQLRESQSLYRLYVSLPQEESETLRSAMPAHVTFE